MRTKLWVLYFVLVAVVFGYLLSERVPPTDVWSYVWYSALMLESVFPVYLLYRLFRYLGRIHTRSSTWFALLGLAVAFFIDVLATVALFFTSFLPGNFFYDLSYAPLFAPPGVASEQPWLGMVFYAALIPFLILGIGLFFAMDYAGYRARGRRTIVYTYER